MVPNLGAIAPDGSPVEVYRHLPAGDEPEIIHTAIQERGEILELGCGTGRITHRLVELRHAVTAVDQSAEMLRHVRGAETVLADIEGLDRALPRARRALLSEHQEVRGREHGRRGSCGRSGAQVGQAFVEVRLLDLRKGRIGATRDPIGVGTEVARTLLSDGLEMPRDPPPVDPFVGQGSARVVAASEHFVVRRHVLSFADGRDGLMMSLWRDHDRPIVRNGGDMVALSEAGQSTAGVLLLTIVAVEYGGTFMLRIVRGRVSKTPFQQAFARAGHAHAGVLVTLALVCQILLDAAGMSGLQESVARSGVPLAAILMPVGFFGSSAGRGTTQPNRLIWLVYAGALSLAFGAVALGLGLLAA
ncbi:MAG: class I SAM-dependent methyltransferase [Actinomycetota bacterium]